MATLDSAQYSAAYGGHVVNPTQMSDQYRVLYATHTIDEDVDAASDIIRLFRLPAGYEIIYFRIRTSADVGTTYTVSLGLYDIAGDGTLGTVVDVDGYFDARVISGAQDQFLMDGSGAGTDDWGIDPQDEETVVTCTLDAVSGETDGAVIYFHAIAVSTGVKT